MQKKLHIIIYGEVHGVGFRNYIARAARARGLSGFVRNRKDETVEIQVAGAQSPLEDFFETVKTGPDSAVIAEIKDEWFDLSEPPDGDFDILDTI